MHTLPWEIFEEILSIALDVHPARHAIPRVNSAWAEVSLPLLHSRIRLTSPRQLRLFSAAQSALRCASWGREVEVELPGGTEGAGVWASIYEALQRCQLHTGSPAKSCCRGVRVLRLRLNSHSNHPDIHLVGEALSLVDPEVFVWRGPDPDHHFSTAIVPDATNQLCRAIRTWSSLRRLELSNISFLHIGPNFARALVTTSPFASPCTEDVGPRQIIIRQAVFVPPDCVLRIVLESPVLREFHLIDVYTGSIWEPRLRIGDLEVRITHNLHTSGLSQQDCLERVREVVRCVAKTERLMGGDRESSQ